MLLPTTLKLNYFKRGEKALNQLLKGLFTFFGFCFLLSNVSYSQSENTESWNLVKSQDGIEVYSQIVSCETEGASVPFEYVVFKVANTSASLKTALLNFEIQFEEGCNGCERSEETSTEIKLESGASIEASCSDFGNRLSYFILNPNFQGSWKYTHSNVYIKLIK